MAEFALRFESREIAQWADRYSYQDDSEITEEVVPRVREQGFLTLKDFVTIGDWKTGRARSRREANPAERIEEITGLALKSTDERVKIGVLQVLQGVSWATASVILHFCDVGRYPVLDFRALWSLGLSRAHYTYAFWHDYCRYIRALSDETDLSMRTIDRALWQYSAENQLPG